ncbi:MAG: 4-hydroxythreonine-4-phosphate dehydrogenase PdxA [Chitinophagales bacterium]|nr:4-hydroxythreonine-4-phosphate dehydrogenase PdxA [Chitinophagales bacterium]MDW8394486.1 4-hydroxythreonine-4-phosphate dehydrogenase PdxA [Chitinophagales bacterium]
MQSARKPVIGITIGDFNGIGPEVILKTFSDNRMFNSCTPLLYGSPRLINYQRKLLNLQQFNYFQAASPERVQPNTFNVLKLWDEELPVQPGKATPESGSYALRSLQAAVADLKAGQLDALVTAPVNKHVIHQPDAPFHGHTDFLAAAAGVTDYCMLLCGSDLRVALATTHIPLQQVSSRITPELLLTKLQVIKDSLIKDFSISKPRIAVLGLNPHAGDGGIMGDEEQRIIAPAIRQAQEKNILAFGPYPADGFFGAARFRSFDAVLAMYHDQGLVPFKLLCFENGVNYTAGLPFVRTAPDHGVAYDLAGKNQADERSFRQAVFLALDIVRNRMEYRQMTANPLPRSAAVQES